MSTSERLDTTATAYACRLEAAEQVSSCGAKAYNLGRMRRDGLAVPPAFVVTDAAFQAFLDHNGLRPTISKFCEPIDIDSPETVQRASLEIREKILAAAIPADVVESVNVSRTELLPDSILIVRSSAVGEDSHQAAFAGQLDSILNVETTQSLHEALLACWASYWSARSLFYQRSRGICLQGMGIVVQQQVRSTMSGVLFTESPDASVGDSTSMVAEYCAGYGADLVSGRVNPGRIRIDRHDSTWRELAAFDPPENSNATELIDDALAAQLADAGLTLERLFGGPQDIEWTVDEHGKLHLVQSRPISVRSNCASSEGPLQDDSNRSRRMVLWSNANVNENYPDAISPFLYSIASAGYYHYFRNLGLAFGISKKRVEALEFPLRHIIGVHAARMYYNLTNIHACLRMAPCGDMLTESFNNFVGATRIAESEGGPNWKRFDRSRLVQFGEMCRIAVKAGWQCLFLSNRVAKFERTVNEFAASTVPELLDDKSLDELLGDLRSFLDIRFHRWTNASLADAASMLSYGMLKRLLNREFPDDDLSALHNTLLKGLPDIVSNVPVTRLWELSRKIRDDIGLTELFSIDAAADILNQIRQRDDFRGFRTEFEDFLDQWGFRCSGELMLTVPSFQENPAMLVEILKAYLKLDGASPTERLTQQDARRQVETARVVKELRRRRLLFFLPFSTKAFLAKRLLKWTQKAIGLRERARLKQALLYSRCRRIALAIGRKLVLRGGMQDQADVFFLTYAELDDLLSGSSMFPDGVRSLVGQRKSAHAELSEIELPETLELPEGTYLTNETECRRSESDASPCEDSDTETRLNGVGACGGCVTGQAAILKDVSEFALLSEGDILVTRQTDPGWGPLFFLIKGLVIERGGMLSHGAILAREYGIPTVVAVEDATRRISHRQTLTVNGDRGVVELTD